tara:strand:- start:374 stop:544 length:171 start_codon:yes stop_codon:yes gene_type:complete
MMCALGDMDEIICLAGALCKTWALLFTEKFGGGGASYRVSGDLQDAQNTKTETFGS